MKSLPIAYGIQNFKAFGAQPNSVPLRPITLVFGPNSAGKSSLLHSMLWLNQALRSNSFDVRFPEISEKAVDLGNFNQTIHGHDTNKRITVELAFKEDQFSKTLQTFFNLTQGLKVSFTIGKFTFKSTTWIEPWLLDLRIEDSNGQLFLSLLRKKLIAFKVISLDSLHPILSKHNPELRRYSIAEKHIDTWSGYLDPDADELNENSNHILLPERIIREDGLSLNEATEDATTEFWNDLSHKIGKLFSELNQLIYRSIGSISYVPPLRELPPRYFNFVGANQIWQQVFHDENILRKINSWLGNKSKPKQNAHERTGYELTLSTFYSTQFLKRELPTYAHKQMIGLVNSQNESYSEFGQEWKELLSKLIPEFWSDIESILKEHPDLIQDLIDEEMNMLETYEDFYNSPDGSSLLNATKDKQREIVATHLNWQAYIDENALEEGFYFATELFQRWIKNHSDAINLMDRFSTAQDSAEKLLVKKYSGSLKIDEYIDSQDVRREIQLRDLRSGVNVSLQDIGVGISQVLPVLLYAYGSEKKLIAIEQPEIHIHPALQSDLADVFIESALGENQNNFLLETHSEHLILRILRRIRETTEQDFSEWPEALKKACPQGIRPADVAVLYVEPGEEGSTLRNLRINELGEFIDEWPNGFFEERIREIF